MFRNLFFCMGKRGTRIRRRPTKIKFDVQISDSFKTEILPSQIQDMLVYIAREGVAVTDLFRRPGNPQDIKKIIKRLKDGSNINWTEYNFYTLANVVKRFLLSVEGGIMGEQAEERLIECLSMPDDQSRIEAMHNVISKLPPAVQQLLALLFGTWFRMIYHTEVNAMSVEAVAKSVTGSVFPSCTYSVDKVNKAAKVMEYLITGFASAELFGQELIEYFTRVTKTSISRIEKFKYEFRYPSDVPRAKSVRLFVRMLLEEGKKHGFDILQHAVSKEVFESAISLPICSATIGEHVGHTDPNPVSTNVVLAASDSVLSGPTGQMSDVAQTSEKRTCVTTTAIAEESSSCNYPCEATEVATSPSLVTTAEGDTSNVVCVPTSHAPEDEEFAVDYILHTPVSSLRRSGGDLHTRPPTTTVRFNSVKRRQMERLQKRSDWFLSPPAGCRSSDLVEMSRLEEEDHSTQTTLSNIAGDLSTPQQAQLSTSGPDILQLSLQLEVDVSADGEGHSDQQPASSEPLTRRAPVSVGGSGPSVEIQVETRYFIVERYYGSDPPPPSSPLIRTQPSSSSLSKHIS